MPSPRTPAVPPVLPPCSYLRGSVAKWSPLVLGFQRTRLKASQQPDCTPGHLWTSVDMRGHVWTCVDICEHLWTLHSAGRSDLADIGGHLWTSVDMRGHVWTCVDMCGHVWTLDPGPRCAYCAAVRPSLVVSLLPFAFLVFKGSLLL